MTEGFEVDRGTGGRIKINVVSVANLLALIALLAGGCASNLAYNVETGIITATDYTIKVDPKTGIVTATPSVWFTPSYLTDLFKAGSQIIPLVGVGPDGKPMQYMMVAPQ